MGNFIYDHEWLDTLVHNIITDILTYGLIELDIFFCDPINISIILFYVYNLIFIHMCHWTSFDALSNIDKCMQFLSKHRTDKITHVELLEKYFDQKIIDQIIAISKNIYSYFGCREKKVLFIRYYLLISLNRNDLVMKTLYFHTE